MKISLLLIGLMAAAFFSAKAQSDVLDISHIVSGTIKNMQGNAIIILQDSNHFPVRVMVNPNVEYNNAQALNDFKKGDKVQVRYQTEQGMNMAVSITKMGGGEV